VTAEPVNLAGVWDKAQVYFYRKAASGLLPARWFEPRLPARAIRSNREGKLHIEVVSHCWGYAHMMIYQLSSLVLNPPKNCRVTMTVFYSTEDKNTVRLLDFIAQHTIPNITWNWQSLHRFALFRRSIGRNHAALASSADWVWFTDCDLLFKENCFDSLNEQLQGSDEALVFPMHERTTTLLKADDPMLQTQANELSLCDIDSDQFEMRVRDRATGPLQITHGDVARACGYCDALSVFQKPDRHWCKAHEDRVFRWLLQTQGVGVEVDNVYRIRHAEKGRYKADSVSALVRRKIREVQSLLKGE